MTTNVEDIYELSPMQQGMLLHTLHDGASDMYLAQHQYTLEGPLDLNALTQAWQNVFAGHPALRTSFHWDGLDNPVQVVHKEVLPVARRENWSDMTDEEQGEWLDRLMTEDRAAGFDLAVAPLQRLCLIRLGAERHSLVWTHHHLLLDGWSVPIFMNEVMMHYQSLTVGGPPPWPAPPFRDYIAWLQQQDIGAAESFWRQTLSGIDVGHLMAMRPLDPLAATGGLVRRVVDIGGEVDDRLREVAARHRVTVSTVLHAAWSVVLRHETGRADVAFGCVSSGRPPDLADVDRIVGMFVNTLPVPVRVPDGGDVGEWLRLLQDQYAAIRQFEYAPLSDIKRWSGLPGQQLFDSMIVVDNQSITVDAGGEAVGPLSVRSHTAYDKVSVPVVLILTPAPVSELHLLLHEARFDPGFADAVLYKLFTVLAAMSDSNQVVDLLEAPGPIQEAIGTVNGYPMLAQVLTTASEDPPTTAREEAIATVYCGILELEAIPASISFFDLGGDSFSAVQAVGSIDGATVAMLALNPSVRELAAALEAIEEVDAKLDAEIIELERRLAEMSDPADE